MSLFSFWSRLKSQLSGNVHVGKDHLGNNYYSIKGTKRRFVDYGGGVVHHGALPPLWRSWLTHRRDVPPTEKELKEDDWKKQLYMKKVEEFEKKDELMQIEERKGGENIVKGSQSIQFEEWTPIKKGKQEKLKE
eukprot:TRINITY_DN10282_c0_g1_i1.p1 TRINITY_DN10282_c0_g1~~TRINITY_DN10282_c0_g1_i1.p1  ORF type:complete len:134 (-),score=65.12 TRINITY_DN10282_c0_g1_i1:176-577(-)